MPPRWSVPRLLRVSRKARHAATARDAPACRELCARLAHLERACCALDADDAVSLLWIDDVGAALVTALDVLRDDLDAPAARKRAAPPREARGRRRASLRLSAEPPSSRRRYSSLGLAGFADAVAGSGDVVMSGGSGARASGRVHSLLASIAGLTKPKVVLDRDVEAVRAASRAVDEWLVALAAVAQRGHNEDDNSNSCISLSDSLPPLPQQYVRCRGPVAAEARAAVYAAAEESALRQTRSIAIAGPHGVGKTVLACALAHDVQLSCCMPDGVAWVQLGRDISDEDIAEQIISCVETIAGGDFRSTVTNELSLEDIAARAACLMCGVSGLVIVDDLCGPRAQRAYNALLTSLGDSSVLVYTTPFVDGKITGGNAILFAQINVRPLRQAASQDAVVIFHKWLYSSAAKEAAIVPPSHSVMACRDAILDACHGLPAALAMAAGFVSKFNGAWKEVAELLAPCTSGHAAITAMLAFLLTKGDDRFAAQLRSLAALPQGLWVSLSALADLWGMDHKRINVSARRLGRLAFADYRLSDAGEDGAVRIRWHVMEFCARLASVADTTAAHRIVLDGVPKRASASSSSQGRTSRSRPWWEASIRDTYLYRRVTWHMVLAGAHSDLRRLLCDFQWCVRRVGSCGLVGLRLDFEHGIDVEERRGDRRCVLGLQRVLAAIESACSTIEGNFEQQEFASMLVSELATVGDSSGYCGQFLKSLYRDARRPWLRPIIEPKVPQSDLMEEASWNTDEVRVGPISSANGDGTYVSSLASNAAGMVVSGHAGGSILVWDASSGERVASFQVSMGSVADIRDASVGAVATYGVDTVISGHSDGSLRIWSIASEQDEMVLWGHSRLDSVVQVAVAGPTVATGTSTGEVCIWKNLFKKGNVPKVTKLQNAMCDEITALHIFPDGRHVCCGTLEGFASVWDTAAPGKRRRVALNGHKPKFRHKDSFIYRLATLHDGKFVLSADKAGTVNLWNSRTGECLWTKTPGFEFSTAVALEAYALLNYDPDKRGRNMLDLGTAIGFPYCVTQCKEDHCKLNVVATATSSPRVVASARVDSSVKTWLEVWHPDTSRVYVAVAYGGNVGGSRISTFEVVTALR